MSLTKKIFLAVFSGLIIIISIFCVFAFLILQGVEKRFEIAVIIALIVSPLCALIIARKVGIHIAEPINHINLENISIYEEITPFALELERYLKDSGKKIIELRERAATIEAVMQNMREGIILVDNKGEVLSANLSSHDIFKDKLGKESMTGKNILLICRDADLLQNMKLCVSGASSEILFEKNNKLYNVFLNPVYNGDKITGAVMLFIYKTEKYKAERHRREFSANVSHELKTPLTTISALSEMIGSGMVRDADIKSFADKISGQTKRLINIIEDIIKLSEFDENKVAAEFSSFNLCEIAESVILNLQEKVQEKKVVFHLEIQENLPDISANRRMADELLYNLCENAIKYNNFGGSIFINITHSEDYFKICVKDTGIGISEQHHSRIFERFYRVDKSRSQKTGGTGLGLSIVKHIVEYHKGRIELESKENTGTAITCYIKSRD